MVIKMMSFAGKRAQPVPPHPGFVLKLFRYLTESLDTTVIIKHLLAWTFTKQRRRSFLWVNNGCIQIFLGEVEVKISRKLCQQLLRTLWWWKFLAHLIKSPLPVVMTFRWTVRCINPMFRGDADGSETHNNMVGEAFFQKFQGRIKPRVDWVSRPLQTREWLQQENADARNKINCTFVNNAWISGLCSKD